MDSLQQQVLSLLSEDWKSRMEIVRETGASEHEVQVALNELQDQIETSYGSVAGLKKARMYRLKECTNLRSAHNHHPPIFNWINAAIPLDESPTRPTRLPQLIRLGLQILPLSFRLLITTHRLLLHSLSPTHLPSTQPVGRVDLGGCPSRSPTDQITTVSRTPLARKNCERAA